MIVNELSQGKFTIRPYDDDGDAYTPTNARYRVDDKNSGASVIAWTAIATPSTAMEIIIPPASNTIIDTDVIEEIKVLTVETDYGTESAHVEEQEYAVRNLQFVS